ncbi:MAG: DUF1269 domain-containing protein [Chloroflexota bacterium]
MTTLTVLKFSTPEGAEQMLDKVKALQKAELIHILDGAIVSWPVGKKKPKTKQLVNLAGLGALQSAFWGMLFGMIFFVPFFGLAVGAAMGALGGKMRDYGIDDQFIEQTREKVTEGTSALFLMTAGAVLDKVVDELKGYDFELIASNMTKEQEDQLMAIFAEG